MNSPLRRLVTERRRVIEAIERAEFEIDDLASKLEGLRRERQSLADRIRDAVYDMPIAKACDELGDTILDAEVIV